MEAVGAAASIISLCTSCSLPESLVGKCKHLTRPTRKLKTPKKLMEKLDARNGDLQRKLDQLWLDKGMEATEEVQLWKKNVDDIRSEVRSLVDDNGQHRPTIGCCHFCSRIKLGERIKEKIKRTNYLLEKGQMPDDSIGVPVLKRGDSIPATPFMEYETHKQILMKIWGFLLDDRARTIGIWGMGGVGKTTIMKEINNRLVKNSSFNSIIWVKVSKDPSLEKLQEDIAVNLGLTLPETNDEIRRAAKLCEAFKRRRKFALVLDDLWEPFYKNRRELVMQAGEENRREEAMQS